MPEELRGLEANGTTRTVVKNERTYYSSRDFYRLRGVLHLVRDKGVSLERAHARVESAATLASATTIRTDWGGPMASRAYLLRRVGSSKMSPFFVCNLLARRAKQLANGQGGGLFSELISVAVTEFLEGRLGYEVNGQRLQSTSVPGPTVSGRRFLVAS